MQVFTDINSQDVTKLLCSGAIGVIRTDTLYGLVCRAADQVAVERIYAIKGRDDTKSPIVLVSNINQLFDRPSAEERVVIESVWPGPVSVIIHSTQAPEWIRRQNDSVAYRMPANDALCALLEKTGPLIAPSANPQSQPPALSIEEAMNYFGSFVDFYVEGGIVESSMPSKLLRIDSKGNIERLR